MDSIRKIPRKNSWRDNKIKCLWLILYYGFAYWLPGSYTMGGILRALYIRRFICRHIFKHMGKNVNIESRVNFGSGFEIEIGDNSGLGLRCHMPSNVKIGNDVLMGPECFFLPFNHAYEDVNRTIKSQGYKEKMEIRIGNDVWIGRETLFNPGRTVADGTVIAARTVVCKDFPAYSVIGGNPSKLIKSRI